MPYAYSLNRCTITLNQQTQLILDLFKKACDIHFKNKNGEEKTITDFVIGDRQLKKGIYHKFLSTLENINEKKYGAGYVSLNQIDYLRLDSKAEKMLESYDTEIDKLFSLNGVSTYELSKEQNLNSAALVFRTLLIRLVTIALCNDNTYFRDGEILLKIYSTFVDQVLSHINDFDNQRIFDYFASKEHVDWMHSIGGAVSAVKMLHSHQDNITECLTTLKSLTREIEAMILAHLVLADSQCEWPLLKKLSISPSVKPCDLSDRFVERKFIEYEHYIMSKTSFNDNDDIKSVVKATGITAYAGIEHLDHKNGVTSIIDARDIRENSHVGALVALKSNKCPSDILIKLETLYNAYFQSRCLMISLEEIDEIVTAASWVPIVMGIINLSNLCKAMRMHCNNCSEILSIPNNDLITQLSFKQAIMHKSFKAQDQLKDMFGKILALEELQNPVRIKKIKYHIQNNLNHLLQIESALKAAFPQLENDVEIVLQETRPLTHSPKLFASGEKGKERASNNPPYLQIAYWAQQS